MAVSAADWTKTVRRLPHLIAAFGQSSPSRRLCSVYENHQEPQLGENDRLFRIAQLAKCRFQGIHHRWWSAEKDDGLRTRRRKLVAEDVSGEPACPS